MFSISFRLSSEDFLLSWLLDDEFSDLDLLDLPCGDVGKEEEAAEKDDNRDQDRVRLILRDEVTDTDTSKEDA